MAKYDSHHAAPPNRPGVNWVEKVGGLPKPIDAIMRALMAKGWAQSRAVATAVNHVKKTCATGMAFGGKTKVSAEARATACRAAAEWESKKARARAMASDPDERRAIELAFKRIEGEAIRIDMAGGLVPKTITVRSKSGKVFQRRIMVRPSQAKGIKSKGDAKMSERGVKVTREVTAVFEALAKVPRDQRPKGWEKAVKTLADARHGGRLGPEKRRTLHDLASKSPVGSPLRMAAAQALKADAAKPAERKKGRRVKPTRKPRKIKPVAAAKGKSL